MPIYTYVCPECGRRLEAMKPMKHSARIETCYVCNCEMKRDFAADTFFAGSKDYAKPIHSDSLAINPNQVAEHKRLFPDIEIDKQSRPVFSNYHDHDAYLKKTGFVKLPQKTRTKTPSR